MNGRRASRRPIPERVRPPILRKSGRRVDDRRGRRRRSRCGPASRLTTTAAAPAILGEGFAASRPRRLRASARSGATQPSGSQATAVGESSLARLAPDRHRRAASSRRRNWPPLPLTIAIAPVRARGPPPPMPRSSMQDVGARRRQRCDRQRPAPSASGRRAASARATAPATGSRRRSAEARTPAARRRHRGPADHAAVFAATAIIQSSPQPMTVSGRASRPNGIRSTAASAIGITDECRPPASRRGWRPGSAARRAGNGRRRRARSPGRR